MFPKLKLDVKFKNKKSVKVNLIEFSSICGIIEMVSLLIWMTGVLNTINDWLIQKHEEELEKEIKHLMLKLGSNEIIYIDTSF